MYPPLDFELSHHFCFVNGLLLLDLKRGRPVLVCVILLPLDFGGLSR